MPFQSRLGERLEDEETGQTHAATRMIKHPKMLPQLSSHLDSTRE